MDRKLLMATAPQMSNYNNWPSKESVQKNRDLYYRQKEQIRRLSPSTTFYKESSRFGNSMKRRNTSFYKNHDSKEFNDMVHDPVSLAVEEAVFPVCPSKAEFLPRRLREKLRPPVAGETPPSGCRRNSALRLWSWSGYQVCQPIST